jgi:SAM-dependent methyltransferase
MTKPSAFDQKYHQAHRDFINHCRIEFLRLFGSTEKKIADIGTQGKRDEIFDGFNLTSLDLHLTSGVDLQADLTTTNNHIRNGTFDMLFCCEVLEHVVDPFAAVREIRRILSPSGYLLVTVPLNARIHGPAPDCFRFTEFGLQVLFRDFEWKRLDKLNTPGRNLFPLHYALMAKNTDVTESDPRNMKFGLVD